MYQGSLGGWQITTVGDPPGFTTAQPGGSDQVDELEAGAAEAVADTGVEAEP